MKRYISILIAALCGILASYAESISVNDVYIEPGQTATVSINLTNTSTNLVSFQMDLALPEGISINKAGCSLSSRFTDEDQVLTIGRQSNGSFRLTSTSFALTPISGTNGEIITLSLTAAANFTGGSATLNNVLFVTSNSQKVTISDTSFDIVIPIPATGISLNSTSLSLTSAGQTSTLTATVTPSNATNKNVTWTSSNTHVARVNSTGVVTAICNGTAIITATTADGTNLSAQCEVTVAIPVPVTGITLSQSALSFNAANQTATLTATVTPENATNKSVTWTSSNTNVATVSSTGVVTAIADGTATITATTADGTNLSATCEVTVAIPVPATGITLSQSTLSFNAANQTATLTATVTPANATNKGVTWTSSNTAVATVSSTGVVTAKANGTATITAKTADGTNLTATCTVTVAIPVPATNITLSQSTLSFNAANQTATLTATVAPSNATNKSVTWTSSNTNVATVSSTGVVTAIADGTATITATTADGTNLSATCEVTVAIPVPATGITLSQSTLSFNAANQTATLTATVTPSNATNKSVTWTSSNPDVATVSNAGVVTAVANGAATIKATTADGSDLTERCAVTVNIPVVVPVSLFDENSIYYIQNVETGLFINAGNAWGTHTVLSDEGLPVNITQMPDGSYTIYFLEGSKSQQLMFRASESGVYVDYNNNSNACQYWTITPASEDGTYHIQSLVTDALYGQEAYPGTYLGNNPTKEACDQNSTPLGVYNDVDGNILDAEGMNITWRFVNTGITRTFNAEVPCGEGTADLTFKVSNFSQRAVEVIASPNDIAGALTIPATVQNENGIEFAVWGIGDNAFNNRTNLTAVEMPESVTTIGGSAFYGCTGLTSVTILGNLTHIWGHAFRGCTSLSDVQIAGVHEISVYVFEGCTSLKSINLPEGLTYIYDSAFRGSGLESITFPSTLTRVDVAAFRDCHALKTIDFNNCTATLEAEVFLGTAIEELVIPETVILKGWTNFGWCPELRSVEMKNINQTAHNDVFKACAKLETAILPKIAVMTTGYFENCTNLRSVTFLSGAPGNDGRQYCDKNFQEVPDDVLFIIPEGTAESYLKSGYKNLSDKSGLPLVREEFEAEAARITTMAEALNDGDKTALNTAITSARTTVNSTDDYMTIYAQIAAIKTAAKTFLTTASLPNEFDVTAAAITNPDFDRFQMGWKTTGGGEKRGWMGEPGYYHVENGDVILDYFIEAWNFRSYVNDGELFQTITSLPAGIYRLEADIIATNQNDANAEVTGVSLFAGNQSTPVATENQKPQHFSVEFTLDEDGDCTIGLSINSTTANWVAMDNVRLYNVGLPEDENDTDISEMDNVIYIERAEGVAGSSASLAVKMKNVLSPVGCSFKLTLPEGFSLVKDTDNDIVYELSNRAKKFSVTRKDWNNGTYDFALTPSTENATISGTEGIVITFRVQVPEGTSLGDYKVNLTNNLIQSKSSGTTQDNPVPDVKTTFTVVDYVLGDVNGDGNVTPADAIMILYRYFEVAQSGFNEAAADINGDGNISPADAIETLYMYFGSGKHNISRMMPKGVEPE